MKPQTSQESVPASCGRVVSGLIRFNLEISVAVCCAPQLELSLRNECRGSSSLGEPSTFVPPLDAAARAGD